MPGTLGLQQHAQHTKQGNAMLTGKLPSTPLIHQHATLQPARKPQCLSLAHVQVTNGCCIERIINIGMNLGMLLDEVPDSSSPRPLRHSCRFVHNRLRDMNPTKGRYKQWKQITSGQNNQRT